MTSDLPQSSRDLAELARWLWPGRVHLGWDGRVTICPQEVGSWKPFDPLESPEDCARVFRVLEKRDQVGSFLREMEVQLHKFRSVDHDLPCPQARASRAAQEMAIPHALPPIHVPMMTMAAWKRVLGRLWEDPDCTGLRMLGLVVALLRAEDMKERMQSVESGTTERMLDLEGSLKAVNPRPMRLLNIIHQLPPLRREIVFFGGVAGATDEEVSRLVGIPVGSVGRELEMGIAEVQDQLMDWHGLTWLGSGLDFLVEAPEGWPECQSLRRAASSAGERSAVEEGELGEDMVALMVSGFLHRLGGGQELAELVVRLLSPLPHCQQKVLIMRFLAGLPCSVIGHRMGLSASDAEQELVHGCQLLEERLQGLKTLRALLAQAVAAFLRVARESRWEEEEGAA